MGISYEYPTEENVLVLSVQENLSRTYNLDKRSAKKLQLILQECEELVRICNRSIETAQENGRTNSKD